ncbi:hypothetical protein QAD02_017430 [Eretmocerus hayati]|uniref:Uncharacterized protein n=1 Tax=Eretmocerus hayati TaxID=131215 RepID=A0ACC2PDV8_9HYME|nr:hypothetical protein QAD02_017430 [Eretmocerus hayati]
MFGLKPLLDTDVEELWTSETGCLLRSELAELSLKYGGLNIWGSRSERAHLRLLRSDIEDWLQCLQACNDGWWFPDALRCIRSSELILKDWDYRLRNGVWPSIENDPEDDKLSKQRRRWEKPSQEILQRVWTLVKEERKLWSALTIK